MSSDRSRLGVAALSILLLAPATLLAGCGKKGDPAPPLRTSPQTTSKLTVSQRGTDLLLELPYPTTTSAGQALDGLTRVEIYRFVSPVPEFQLELLEPETDADAAPGADATTHAPADDAERTEADEPREPVSTDFYAEVGIEAADELDEMKAQREVGEAMTEAGEEADAAKAAEKAETADAGPGDDDYTPPSRQALLRQMLKPLDDRQFEGAAERVAVIAGDDLERAVSGGQIELRLPVETERLAAPALHYLAVRTVGATEEPSDLSNQVVLVPRTPPPAPSGLDAAGQADGIRVSWQPQGEVVGYNLYRRNARERQFDVPVAVPTAERANYLDRTARFGETYLYAVTAVAQRNPLVESAVTQVRELDYRDTFPPPAPANLVALAEEGRVRVVWRGSEAEDLAGYQVSRRVGPAGDEGDFVRLTADPQPGTEYVDRDVVPGQTYTYRVEAVDESGNVSDGATSGTAAR